MHVNNALGSHSPFSSLYRHNISSGKCYWRWADLQDTSLHSRKERDPRIQPATEHKHYIEQRAFLSSPSTMVKKDFVPTNLGPFEDTVKTEVVLAVLRRCNWLAVEWVQADGTFVFVLIWAQCCEVCRCSPTCPFPSLLVLLFIITCHAVEMYGEYTSIFEFYTKSKQPLEIWFLLFQVNRASWRNYNKTW